MTEKDIIKRNKRLQSFFENLNIPVKIIGDINTPAVIYKNKKVLSCYAHNFDLIFIDRPKNGTEIFRHKLKA
ncbi:hypothetical protein JSO59_004070 [Riemerella anatipestifer]|uniref:hypothetical protein n=1 Tax=Riemerella anatipestifer TaxID=34085 RepID=UPI0030BA82D7